MENDMQQPFAIDRRTLAHVLEDLGDDLADVFEQLTDIFLSDTPPLLDALKSAIIRGDFQDAKRAAHRLKGGCAQLGALVLARDAEQVEHFCSLCDQRQLEHLVEKMQTDWRQLADELATLRALAKRGDAATFLSTIDAL